MKRFKLAVPALFLAMILCFGLVLPTSASESQQSEYVINDSELEAHYDISSARKFADLSDYEELYPTNADSAITDIRIVAEKNKVTTYLIIANEQEKEEVKFTGEVLSINGRGYYDDKLIIGDFAPSGYFKVVLFKIFIDSETKRALPKLTLLVEDIRSGELLESSFAITANQFNNLLCLAKNTTELLEATKEKDSSIEPRFVVAEKVIALMQPRENYLPAEPIAQLLSQSNSSFKSTNTYSGTSATLSTLQTFCNSLSAAPSSGITPSTTMQTVLSQTGWKMYKTSTYFYVMHGVANTSTEQLVGITVASVSDNRPNNGILLSASYTIVGSCTLSYNKTTKIATMLMKDSGIRLENASIAIELVGGTTNFYTATKSWVLESNGGVKNVLIAISANLSVASAIWDALTTTSDSSATTDFGTDSNQTAVYGGLVRAVGNQAQASKYMWGINTSIGINASFYNTSGKTYSSHRIAYGFTGYSLL